jgi:hypothetical protein
MWVIRGDHMLGQFFELPAWAGAPGVPGRGLALLVAPVVVLAGDVLLVLLVEAALAIAAPLPATTADTASVVSSGRSLWVKLVHLLGVVACRQR